MSFQQGLSGLNASSKNLEVIGNNIANAQTFGAKSSRAEFADVYANSMNGAGGNAIGIGVNLAAVSQQFSQGNITITENAMDLAINGPGFFQVTDGNNPTVYTRNGQFKLDRDGFIVNNQQQKLMGYAADNQGVIQSGQARPIQLPTDGIEPRATDRIDIEFNLDARAAVTEPATPGIDVDDPTTYNNATSVTVYDAKGQEVALTYYFQKAATDDWNVYVTANGEMLTGMPQSLQFPANGGNPLVPAGVVTIDIPATPAGTPQTLPITGVELDLTNATQYGASFGVTDLSQSGYALGQLSGIAIEGNGIVMARYSNGQSKPAGQLELANFRNPQGLQPLGGNAWAATFTSGDPVRGAPSTGNIGALQSGSLEESNVDLTAELVNMITAQRSYQANAQTIKTQDSVLQTLVNLR
ncbi:MAG: flagellar hook protein FlgE [Methylibium sp.]|uniref:flagellar hook protein FlgE n=1 Tax=Methylibium sp. TaxID=2067992 RepID=UPI0018130D73|nr:flagellar hook protein FlgE [Methylibium sp.]MBA3599286.1 flagellar hook protein FlgE [Methylibium sp.]